MPKLRGKGREVSRAGARSLSRADEMLTWAP